MSISAASTAQMLGGTTVLGVEVKSDRDLEKLVLKGLPTEAMCFQHQRSYRQNCRSYLSRSNR